MPNVAILTNFVLKGQYHRLSFWRDNSTRCCFERTVSHVFVWRDRIERCCLDGTLSHIVVLNEQYHMLSFWWDSIARCPFEGTVSHVVVWDSITRCRFKGTVSHIVVLKGQIRTMSFWRVSTTRCGFEMTVPYVVVLKGQFQKMIQWRLLFFSWTSSLVCCCYRISFSFLKTHGYSTEFDCLAVLTSLIGRWNCCGHRTATNILLGDDITKFFLSFFYWVVSNSYLTTPANNLWNLQLTACTKVLWPAPFEGKISDNQHLSLQYSSLAA
jgi:hypothetical protein